MLSVVVKTAIALVTEILPPVIDTALAFCVAIVPRPVMLAAGTEVNPMVTLPVS